MIHLIETDVALMFMELYAIALLPQIKACSTSDYGYLLNKIVFVNADTSKSLHIAHFQKMYSYLGVTFEDIGA